MPHSVHRPAYLWIRMDRIEPYGPASESVAWSRNRNDAVTTDSQACEMDVATLEILVLRA